MSALFESPADKEGWLLRSKLNLGDDAVASGLLDYSKFDKAHLNVEQRFAYEIVTRHAEATLLALHNGTPPPEALFLIVDGCGGTGKSHVLHCIARYIRERATRRSACRIRCASVPFPALRQSRSSGRPFTRSTGLT